LPDPLALQPPVAQPIGTRDGGPISGEARNPLQPDVADSQQDTIQSVEQGSAASIQLPQPPGPQQKPRKLTRTVSFAGEDKHQAEVASSCSRPTSAAIVQVESLVTGAANFAVEAIDSPDPSTVATVSVGSTLRPPSKTTSFKPAPEPTGEGGKTKDQPDSHSKTTSLKPAPEFTGERGKTDDQPAFSDPDVVQELVQEEQASRPITAVNSQAESAGDAGDDLVQGATAKAVARSEATNNMPTLGEAQVVPWKAELPTPRRPFNQPFVVPDAQRGEAASTSVSITFTPPAGTGSRELGSHLLESGVAQDVVDRLSSLDGVSAVSSVPGPLTAGQFKVLEESGSLVNGRMSFSWQYRVS